MSAICSYSGALFSAVEQQVPSAAQTLCFTMQASSILISRSNITPYNHGGKYYIKLLFPVISCSLDSSTKAIYILTVSFIVKQWRRKLSSPLIFQGTPNASLHSKLQGIYASSNKLHGYRGDTNNSNSNAMETSPSKKAPFTGVAGEPISGGNSFVKPPVTCSTTSKMAGNNSIDEIIIAYQIHTLNTISSQHTISRLVYFQELNLLLLFPSSRALRDF